MKESDFTMKNKGFFITFEGVEGSGKSTQMELLGKFLLERGFDILLTQEPGGTEIGDKIRDILLDPENKGMDKMVEALLYAASRAQLVAEVIKPALEAGKVVICDRYFDSSVAYQVYGRGIPFEVIEAINKRAIENAKPDITFFLDISVEVGLERATVFFADRIEKEDIEFHRRVRKGYLELAKKDTKRFIAIEALKESDEIHRRIIEKIKEFFKV